MVRYVKILLERLQTIVKILNSSYFFSIVLFQLETLKVAINSMNGIMIEPVV